MKVIKSFKLFESGLPYSYAQDIQIAINELLAQERFYPHINQENKWIGGMRKFNVGVVANESKWGVQYEVVFRLDEPVDINLVNNEIKSSWIDIMEIVMDMTKSQGKVKLTKFDYFGHTALGRKNGHTGEVEDVTDKLEDAIELSETESKPTNYHPIMLQFTVTN
jgi:hypothetical protein